MSIERNYCYQTLAAELTQRMIRRDEEVRQLLEQGSPEAVLKRAKILKDKVKESLECKFESADLQAVVTGILHFDEYSIEKVIINGLYDNNIPVNVYVPNNKAEKRCPAIIVPMGHWPDGKEMPENQILCANFAMQGFIAATYDPICQGERKLWDNQQRKAKYGEIADDMFAVSMHMIPGNLFYLLNKNLMSVFVYEGRRVIDYVCSRDDVDTDQIGLTGQSGGGTQTTYIALLDDRVKVYSPIQCLTKQQVALPAGIGDCEQSILNISAADAFDYEDILWASLPKPVMMNCGSEDMFSIEGVRYIENEMTKVYSILGKENDFSVCVADCEHVISPNSRLFAYDWFNRKFGTEKKIEKEKEVTIQPSGALDCMPAGSFKPASILSIPQKLLEKEEEKRTNDPALIKNQLSELLKIRKRQYTIEATINDVQIMHVSNCRSVAFKLFNAVQGKEDNAGISMVITDDSDIAKSFTSIGDCVQALPWGMDEAFHKDIQGYDTETCLFNISAVMGESLMANRVNQVLTLADYCFEKTNQKPIHLVGVGAGAFVALLAAAVAEKPVFQKIVLFDLIESLDRLFDDLEYNIPESLIIPGICSVADIKEILSIINVPVLTIQNKNEALNFSGINKEIKDFLKDGDPVNV